MKATKSSGNVFRDIGFPAAEAGPLAVKADLVSMVARAVQLRGLTQTEAARLCGTEQATLSKVLRGKVTSVTIDLLAKWLLALGWNVKITASPHRRSPARLTRGRISVVSE